MYCRNSLHISQELWQYGMREYYRGMGTILMRNGPSNILFFGLRTPLKNALPNPQELWWGHILTDFVSGAFLGAFISTLMYPVNVIKTHQQCQVCHNILGYSRYIYYGISADCSCQGAGRSERIVIKDSVWLYQFYGVSRVHTQNLVTLRSFRTGVRLGSFIIYGV